MQNLNPPLIVAIVVCAASGLIAIIAIIRYKTVDEVLRLWAAVGSVASALLGAIGGHFFTQQKAETQVAAVRQEADAQVATVRKEADSEVAKAKAVASADVKRLEAEKSQIAQTLESKAAEDAQMLANIEKLKQEKNQLAQQLTAAQKRNEAVQLAMVAEKTKSAELQEKINFLWLQNSQNIAPRFNPHEAPAAAAPPPGGSGW